MSLIRNIFDSYRAPRSIFEGFSNGPLEERSALGFLAGGCLLAFISTWPAFARMSYFTEQTLEMMLAGALFAWIFLAPLFFYILVGFITLILFFVGFQGIGLQPPHRHPRGPTSPFRRRRAPRRANPHALCGVGQTFGAVS